MTESSLPDYLRVAQLVSQRGRVTTKELTELMQSSAFGKPPGLDEAERAGLIRNDGSPGMDTKAKNFFAELTNSYWVPGPNSVVLAIRRREYVARRQQINAAAAAMIRRNLAVLNETFSEQGFRQELEQWAYEDAVASHDEWQLRRDAEALHQPVPDPEPSVPEPPAARTPPKPRPWRRKD